MSKSYYEELFKEGKMRHSYEVAKRMLEKGKYPIEEIAEISGLTPDQIQYLIKS